MKKIFTKYIYIRGYFKTGATGVSSFFYRQIFKNTNSDGRLSTSNRPCTTNVSTYITRSVLFSHLFHEYYSNSLDKLRSSSPKIFKHFIIFTYFSLQPYIEFSYAIHENFLVNRSCTDGLYKSMNKCSIQYHRKKRKFTWSAMIVQ